MRSQNNYYKLMREKLDKAKTSAVNDFQGLALAHNNECTICLSTEDILQAQKFWLHFLI